MQKRTTLFTLIIVSLLVIANIGMDVLTSMRAYVGGEGLWSKAQKDAVHYLLRYGKSRSEDDYERYLLLETTSTRERMKIIVGWIAQLKEQWWVRDYVRF